MKFNGLTKQGSAYLAKIQAAGTPPKFTKMKFGDGILLENENPADLTDIKKLKVEKSILKKEQKGNAVSLTTQLDNVSLKDGYFPRETGVYVLDGDTEILYFYINDGNETSWIPPEVDGPHRAEIIVNLIATDVESIVVHNDGKDLYITKDFLDGELEKKENAFSKNSAFNKNFGKTAGTVLEGNNLPIIQNQFNGIAGGTFNAKYIQDSGTKTAGQMYLDKVNGKMYKCIQTTTGTTNNITYFKDISAIEIDNRLENFSKTLVSGTTTANDSNGSGGRAVNLGRPINAAVGVHVGSRVLPVIIDMQNSDLKKGILQFKTDYNTAVSIVYIAILE